MTIENLIITVISHKYSFGSAVLDLNVPLLPELGSLSVEAEMAVRPLSCCDTVVYKPVTGVILALMST